MPKKPSQPQAADIPHALVPAADAEIPATFLPATSTSPPPPVPVPNMQEALRKVFGSVMNNDDWLRLQLPSDTNLTGTQRRRLFSARARKFGFIVKAWEIANTRPAYRPPGFSLANMAINLGNVEEARQLLAVIGQLQRLVDDYLLTVNDTLYRDALLIYGQLQTMARARIHGAEELFQILRQFFTLRRRNPNQPEPTEHELERQFHSLVHGHSDGEMVIKNESPHMVGGEHEVVADVHKRGKRGAEIKVKEED